MRVQFVGQVAIALRMMSGAALQASGDTLTPMKATTITRIIHVALSPCLVFGWLFFPEWGLPGAAAANGLAQLVGGAINFRALFTGTSRLHLTLHGYRVDLPLLWQIAKLGMPASVTSAERTIAQLMLLGIVAPFGDNVLAAFSLTRRSEMIANMGVGGLGQSAGIMAAQNLGAGKPDRAKSAVRWALLYSSLFLLATGALLYFYAEPVLAVFNEEAGVLDTAVIWLRIQVVGYVFMGAGMVFMQTFNTSGDTTVPMIVTLISIWGVQQPLALVLPEWTGLGEYGIGWAINAAMFVRCFVFLGYFLWGPWTTKRVLGVRGPR
jgi:putative MATE family efflux protein